MNTLPRVESPLDEDKVADALSRLDRHELHLVMRSSCGRWSAWRLAAPGTRARCCEVWCGGEGIALAGDVFTEIVGSWGRKGFSWWVEAHSSDYLAGKFFLNGSRSVFDADLAVARAKHHLAVAVREHENALADRLRALLQHELDCPSAVADACEATELHDFVDLGLTWPASATWLVAIHRKFRALYHARDVWEVA